MFLRFVSALVPWSPLLRRSFRASQRRRSDPATGNVDGGLRRAKVCIRSLDSFARRRGATAFCALQTAGVDVKRTLQTPPADVAFGGFSRCSPRRKGAFVAPVVDVCEGKQAAPA